MSKAKNWVKLRSFTSKSLSLAVILSQFSRADPISLKPRTFGWHFYFCSNRTFSWYRESVGISTSIILIVNAAPQRWSSFPSLLSPQPTISDSKGQWGNWTPREGGAVLDGSLRSAAQATLPCPGSAQSPTAFFWLDFNWYVFFHYFQNFHLCMF